MLYFGCICFDAQTLAGTLSTGAAIEVVAYKDATKALNSKNNTEELKAMLVGLDAKDDYEMGMHFMHGKGGKMETMDISFKKKENGQHYFTIDCVFKTPADVNQMLQAVRKMTKKPRSAVARVARAQKKPY